MPVKRFSNCIVCGQQIEIKSVGRPRKFCSRSCYQKSRYDKKSTVDRVKKWRSRNKDKCLQQSRLAVRRGSGAFHHIKRRCNNSDDHAYHSYGALGIKFLFERKEFLEFYFRTSCCEVCKCQLNDVDRRVRAGRTIDRINNDGNYEPSNCRIICRSCNSSRKKRCK